ncbi:hypothetical protein RchiOBHm_Chr6g0293961 [Rosa chinensis]|uniref:Uncharacterized protein n=1 Tax=Rosa chinensis TaxID=74649 RepID=A0A2P6PWS4_ROSCH|nr:uncharacterized protein LOC112168745 [Rosa chinensis]PRQ26380.1 hypothetical protein RchiOBHm_Chr6g0293961 [Rosa chinensis]
MSRSHKALDSLHPLDSCTFQLHSWRPFQIQQQTTAPTSKTLDSDPTNPKPYYTKRPCLSNRATSFSIDAIDMSRLTLVDDDRTISGGHHKHGSFRFIAKKRRRRGSRSVSGRSSDRSGTRRCCSVGASAAYGTCSDFPVAIGTDSSGELFGNGDANWASDVSEARNSRKERDGVGSGEKENPGVGFGPSGGFDAQGNESGYGSEPGYRGDAEFGYGDELDEEEEDARLLFWGNHFGDSDTMMEVVGENTFTDQKSHHRCRRKKHDCRMVVDSLR